MANRTIGGTNYLDDFPIDNLTDQQQKKSLAIWDYDVNYTKRISPKDLIDNVSTIQTIENNIDDIKKDLGGSPYLRVSQWESSKYANETGYPEKTDAFTEIRYIEADLTSLSSKIDSLKNDLGYDDSVASSYHSIYNDVETPTDYKSAYLWLDSLEERVGIGYGDSPTNNAFNYCYDLDNRITVISSNYLKKKYDRYWSAQNSTTYNHDYNRKTYEKDDSATNQSHNKYLFALQNDGNIVLYRVKETEQEGAVIQSDKQWIWQSGPEYSPAIYRLKFKYTPSSSVSTTASSVAIDLNPNSTATFTNNGITFTPTSTNSIACYTNNTCILSVRHLSIDDYNLSNIFSNNGRRVKIEGLQKNQGTNPLEIELICCNESNIVDPTNYPNT